MNRCKQDKTEHDNSLFFFHSAGSCDRDLASAIGGSHGEEGSALAGCWPHTFGFRRVCSPNPPVSLSLQVILVSIEEGMQKCETF